MLTNKQLTLLDPATWDDRNDSYYLKLYTKRKSLECTLALCLTEKNETYHHWSVFTSRENGVCIVFDRKKLEAHLDTQKNIMHGPVKYMMLSTVRKYGVGIEDLPFMKRFAFSDESEYRIIHPSCRDIGCKHIQIPMDIIRKVSVNPWAPDAFFKVIKDTIKNISGCEKVKVGKSSLIDNKEWRRIGDKIA
ncbi:DUF2971 domain-containing protein [Shewanella dokdonensis]|uniref:DUF2971 domain-containing protein n=1 Tax=Shewanella dokdonensis TaxID=712036 RepID=A0ABX8DBP5_9GAMM|nr:hypothetical protein [Shewanella dokdonensis]MCL1075490.1 DUF2971 domain-containing protein [Shewanella dokdonensis]QVK22166.1 DUF2971 domain-containing protein [Shewanella dokdonensis]